VIEARSPEKNADITRDRYLRETAEMKTRVKAANANYFEIDGTYEEAIDSVYAWIAHQLQQQLFTG